MLYEYGTNVPSGAQLEDQRVAGLRPAPGRVTFFCPLVLVQHRKARHHPNMTEKLLTGVKCQVL